MLNPIQIETSYKEFISGFPQCAHDGIIDVNLHFLHDAGLLDILREEKDPEDQLSQYFHIIESAEKVTLFNEQFIVWIIPKTDPDLPKTTVLIALNHENKAELEVAFSVSGIYNVPDYVLKILQYFLTDVIETEATILDMEKSQ